MSHSLSLLRTVFIFIVIILSDHTLATEAKDQELIRIIKQYSETYRETDTSKIDIDYKTNRCKFSIILNFDNDDRIDTKEVYLKYIDPALLSYSPASKKHSNKGVLNIRTFQSTLWVRYSTNNVEPPVVDYRDNLSIYTKPGEEGRKVFYAFKNLLNLCQQNNEEY